MAKPSASRISSDSCFGGLKASGTVLTLSSPAPRPWPVHGSPVGLDARVRSGASGSGKASAEWAGLGAAVPGLREWPGGCGHAPPRAPSAARSLAPLRSRPNRPSLLSSSLFVLKPVPAPSGWGGGRVPPPPTPPGEGGAGPAGAHSPPPPPPPRPAPAGSPAPRAESEANARSLIYGRPALPGERAPLSLGSGMSARKRASALAAAGLEHQEFAQSHRCPHSLSLLWAPASFSGPSLPAS